MTDLIYLPDEKERGPGGAVSQGQDFCPESPNIHHHQGSAHVQNRGKNSLLFV